MSVEWIRRILVSTTLTVLVAVAVAFISGCSVYKSNGRKTFEDRAPDHVQSKARTLGEQPFSVLDDSTTCWTQPKQEPLWETPENTEIRVRTINREIIEVCFVTQN